MPRRSSGGRSRPALKSSGYTPVRNAPKPVTPAPPPVPATAPVMGSRSGGLGSAVAEGMAFGGGSAIAHRAMDAIMGPRVIHHETVASPAPPTSTQTVPSSPLGSDACGYQIKSFQECVNSSGDDISKCQFYMDMLNECRKRSSGSVLTA